MTLARRPRASLVKAQKKIKKDFPMKRNTRHSTRKTKVVRNTKAKAKSTT